MADLTQTMNGGPLNNEQNARLSEFMLETQILPPNPFTESINLRKIVNRKPYNYGDGYLPVDGMKQAAFEADMGGMYNIAVPTMSDVDKFLKTIQAACCLKK